MKKTQPFDFKREYRALFHPGQGRPEMVDVPPIKYLQVKGQGDPSTSETFAEAIQSLYGMAYTIKFMLKRDSRDPFEFKVAPLSGLWCAEDISAFAENRRDEWLWTLMIPQPDRVTEEVVSRAKMEMDRKEKGGDMVKAVRLEIVEEGVCAQILHRGPYSEEGPTIRLLHDYIDRQGYVLRGEHHEIYLGDPRRARPENLKTIIRHPVERR